MAPSWYATLKKLSLKRKAVSSCTCVPQYLKLYQFLYPVEHSDLKLTTCKNNLRNSCSPTQHPDWEKYDILCFAVVSIGSVAFEKLCTALTNNSLVKGIKQASPFAQTSCLEGFHSLLNQFAPKMIGYSYVGMYCRYMHIVILI